VTDGSLYALLGTALVTGLLHTLIPDHWLPFVLIGRSRGWSARQTALVSGLSASIHVGLSILLGFLAIGIGGGLAAAVGESLEQAGAWLLVLFGVVYGVWSWTKGGHFHPGGALAHGGERGKACAGGEGDANPEHLHYHADDRLIRGRPAWSALGLALIVGANPCVLLLPLMLAAAARGGGATTLVLVAYALPTIGLMVGLSVLGVSGGRSVRLPGAAKYTEAASGLMIAGLGLVFLWLHG
jgi:ABC-type nickel/cobalt efflux system permease component RcnA